jgi:ribosomal protein L16 Arg81 hydroxylase
MEMAVPSMSNTFASMLHPLSPREFCIQYYGQKPLYIAQSPDKFKNLFGWQSLNGILNSSPIPHPTMKMVLGGKPIIPSDATSIVDACRNGATLVIEQIHKYDKSIGAFAARISNEIGEPVRVNLYFSQPEHQGYKRHYDTHDVFILQLAGSKKWQVFEPTIKFPLFAQKIHGALPPTAPILECALEAGHVLYIPRGYWHEATARLEPSLHLTLGVYARTGIDFLSWLTDELRADVRWRETFPRTMSERFDSMAGNSEANKQHLEKLKEILTAKLSQLSLLDEYRRFCIAREHKLSPFNFPSQVLATPCFSEQTKFSRPVYQQVFLERGEETGMVDITIWGMVLSFGLEAENILRYVFSVPEFTGLQLLEVSPELTWSDISEVLTCLVTEEVIKVEGL